MTLNNKPLVSFVVLSYNFEPFLQDCIESVLKQQGDHDFEIIIVDDASSDESVSLIRSYSDPRIHFVQHRINQGHIVTVHDGISYAKGKFIARIDGDDRYHSNFLNDVLPIFDAHPEVGLVYGDASLINEKGEVTEERSEQVHMRKDFKGNEFLSLLDKNFICAPTVIARSEAWLSALPVPEGLAFHDWYFTLMISREYEFYYISRVLADYRVHPQNLHSKISRDKSEETSIFRLLNRVFNEREEVEELEIRKRQVKRRVYSSHYLTLANKYFWFEMNSDARRCYLRALNYNSGYVFRGSVVRRLIGTLVGRKTYEVFKGLFKSFYSRKPAAI